VNLDVDYQNIQDNFSQLDICFNVDHVPFSNTTAQTGYHKSIHFNPESTTAIPAYAPNNYVTATQYPQGVPPTVAGIGQLFSAEVNDAISVDTGLYWKTGNGLQVAMTRNFTPTIAATGFTFLPGGLIMQWGSISSPIPSGGPVAGNQVTFPLTFPNAVFSITLGPVRANTTNEVLTINSVGITLAKFNVLTGSNNYARVYWQAIGY
jgi:hypothetical protein